MSATYVEPEGLYPTYRLDTTKRISQVCKTGESFRVPAFSGTGKSKYFRYITTSKTVQSQHFSDITLYYIDLNRVYSSNTEQLIRYIGKVLGCKATGVDIEKQVEKEVKNGKKVYLILDQAENLNEFDKQTARFLRSLRDIFKGKFAYILSYEMETKLDPIKLNYLLEISPIEIKFDLLTDMEAKETCEKLAKTLNLKLSKEEIQSVVNVANGFPKTIKQLLTQRLAGVELEQAIKNISAIKPENTKGKDKKENYIDIIEKNMTKSEQLIFKELLKSEGAVAKRDELAAILSPESEGEGVSNEAIDQVISRIRKALKKLDLPYSIITARGIGYYVEHQ